eukprot:s9701_g3.t1
MPTRLFTYLSADGISNSVTVCSPGAAELIVDQHYDKLVALWSAAGKPVSRYALEECVGPLLTTFWQGKQGFAAFEVTNAAQPAGKRAQWNRTPVNDFQLKEGLQLLECDTDQIFDDRWRKAVQKGSLEGRVVQIPKTRNSLSEKLRCREIRVVFAALAVTFVLLLGILKLSGGGSSRHGGSLE